MKPSQEKRPIANNYSMTKSNLEKFKKKVFLCHQRENVDFIKKLEKRLLDNKINVWVDYEALMPGDDWEEKIIEEIKTIDAVIIVISKSATREGFFHKEIKLALKRVGKMRRSKRAAIIPLVLDSSIKLDKEKKLKALKKLHAVYIDDFHNGIWFENLLVELGIITNKEEEFSFERQEIIVRIEKLKAELIECWYERNKYESGTRKYRRFEKTALNIVSQIDKDSEKIKKRFIPQDLYKQIMFNKLIHNKAAVVKQEEIIFYPPNGILVDKRHIDKRLFLIEKGGKPQNAKASKIIGGYELNGIMYGFAPFYGAKMTPYIQKGQIYNVYDGFSDDLSIFIGTFKA